MLCSQNMPFKFRILESRLAAEIVSFCQTQDLTYFYAKMKNYKHKKRIYE